jgi:ABC-type uncharacterized transport system YnjBCD ATPase subunit
VTAARALRSTDARGDEIVAALTAVLANRERKVRAAAAQVGRIGVAMLFHRYPTTAARQRIRPKLLDLLTHPSW